MRTTVDLPDPLFREMKAFSARRGSTIKEFIVQAVRRELARGTRAATRREGNLPLIPSRKPGALRSLTNAEIEDLLD